MPALKLEPGYGQVCAVSPRITWIVALVAPSVTPTACGLVIEVPAGSPVSRVIVTVLPETIAEIRLVLEEAEKALPLPPATDADPEAPQELSVMLFGATLTG